MAYFVIGDYGYNTDPAYDIPEGTVAVELEAPNTQSSYSDIPDTVIDPDTSITYVPVHIDNLFEGCTNLVVAPHIPDTVTSMQETFKDCVSLTQVGNLPSQLEYMGNTFYNCEKLRKIPRLPSSLVYMLRTFYNCYKLLGAFDMETGAQEPIEVPAGVTSINYAFYNCQFLTGDIYLLRANPLYSDTMLRNAFNGTSAPIRLHTYIPNAKNALLSYSKWIECNYRIDVSLLGSKYLPQEKAVRVDMLLYTYNGGYITGLIPNGILYDMGGNQIPWGTDFKGWVYCYALFNPSSAAPNNKLSIQVKNVAPEYNVNTIGYPSTATPTQIKQEGETDPISPTIDVTNIRFNPEASGLNVYTVGDVIGVTLTDMTKSQTNVNGDVKHIVTHADNVKIDNTTTLQDWITEQYNYLIP